MVLNDLILHHTHTGLTDSQFCQRNTFLIGSGRGSKEDFIHLLLSVC